MATFEVKVYRLKIEEHPNADALELAVVGDYRAIVLKGQYKTGDLAVYIPEASIVPDWLIKELGLEGRLAGKQQNRVKAIKLRGILSQGLVYPLDASLENRTNSETPHYALKFMDGDTICYEYGIKEGQDVTEMLGIVKYEPPIPVHMQGEVFNAHGYTLSYDIENVKKYPDILQENEHVAITEKLHGTWCCMGYHPEVDCHIVTSKGLSASGLAFKMNEANQKNLYMRALNATAPNSDGAGGTIIDRMCAYFAEQDHTYACESPFYILGEVYGQGVQKKLTYGVSVPQFRVFDIYVGEPGTGRYLNHSEITFLCIALELEMVPLLYIGAFSKEKMLELTDGNTTLNANHMREGIVIKPLEERRDDNGGLGRVILKSVSEAYLLSKGGTDYN